MDPHVLLILLDGEYLHPGVRAITLLPGEIVPLTVAERGVACTAPSSGDASGFELRACTDSATGSLIWETDGGTIVAAHGPGTTLRYQAPPTPGTYHLRLDTPGDDDADLGHGLAVVVLTPFDQKRGPSLSGYLIGDYPDERGLAPDGRRRNTQGVRGFAAVTPDNQNLPLATHFLLRDFVCKQQPDHVPKYVVLNLRLLDKLERLVDRLTVVGGRSPHLTIMSGYRTPHYNRAIGNATVWSRHVLGDAADVFVDDDGDGMMDDLDHDGTITRADAEVLLRIVDTLDREERFPGGAAAYGATPAHGPFVHLDARGYRARW